MLQEGVTTYIENVHTSLYLLQVNSMLLPITVNEREYSNSYLTSNYFPIKYAEEKLQKKGKRWHQFYQKTLISGGGLFLKGVRINKMVIVNNWLLTTNIYPPLTAEEIEALTQYLTTRFADHILVFRNINMYACAELFQVLEKQRYRLLYTRDVYIYDPAAIGTISSKALYHHRRDRRLIDAEGYEVSPIDQLGEQEVSSLLQLYYDLYLNRHTIYSPKYTERYLRAAVEKGFLHILCIKQRGEICGTIGFHERRKTLIAPFSGYTQGQDNYLYRILTILAIDEAAKRGVVLNDGSGGEGPKYYRGMKPFPEYIALYDHHLPYHRRFFWSMAQRAMKYFVRPHSFSGRSS